MTFLIIRELSKSLAVIRLVFKENHFDSKFLKLFMVNSSMAICVFLDDPINLTHHACSSYNVALSLLFRDSELDLFTLKLVRFFNNNFGQQCIMEMKL